MIFVIYFLSKLIDKLYWKMTYWDSNEGKIFEQYYNLYACIKKLLMAWWVTNKLRNWFEKGMEVLYRL